MRNSKRVDILIVDDLPEKHLVYRASLDDLDQNIVSVTSGEEALLKLIERDFAVILLDVNMPGMSGHETAKLIRQRRRSRHTPIIFVTAFADEAQTAEGYALGAVDYILSPVVPEILRAKVKVFVELEQMRAELADSHASLEQRVEERTAELAQSAERLEKEVLVRKSAEERLTILVRELSHRVKNMLAVLQSIATRTLIPSRSAEEASEILAGRLHALGRAHELLVEASWSGAALKNIVDAELAGFTERVRTDGPGGALERIRRADVRAHRARAVDECGEVRRALQCQGRGRRELVGRLRGREIVPGVSMAGARRPAGLKQRRQQGLWLLADFRDGTKPHLRAQHRSATRRSCLQHKGAAGDDHAGGGEPIPFPCRAGRGAAGERRNEALLIPTPQRLHARPALEAGPATRCPYDCAGS